MSQLLQELSNVLKSDQILTGRQLEDRYSHIWRMDEQVDCVAMLLPESTEDVSNICRICNSYGQAIVIHGGLTNLVGSTRTQSSDVVVSLERMNQIVEIDKFSRTVTLEAGVIIEQAQLAAVENDLLFPLNFGAKGSAQIGGSIASNAGGLRVLRYGMCRALVLGLEAVLADGTVVSSLKKMIKDNSGYDLKQLFIGSEGTLGIITKAIMKLTELPKSRTSAFIALDSYEKVLTLLKTVDKALAGTLSAYELIWNDTFKALTSDPSLLKAPLAYDYEYYVLIESLGNDFEVDQKKLSDVLEGALESGIILDAVIANSDADQQWFWNIREDVGILNQISTYDQHFDVSLPLDAIGTYVKEVKDKLKNELSIEQSYAFGHVADGNIHFIVGKENNSDELRKAINEIIYQALVSLNGSVSAEHGIGLDKKEYLPLCRSEIEINLMKLLKQTLDPNNILNPGRIF